MAARLHERNGREKEGVRRNLGSMELLSNFMSK
jgi:hypothetical protein